MFGAALCSGLASVASAYHVPATAALRPAAARPAMRSSPSMALDPTLVVDHASSLLSEAAAEELGPLLYGQLATSATLIGGGFALDAFFEVPEPEEFETPEGETDIYRDSPLRYLGYANEVGEAFRPLVPVEVVYFSYFAAISYILADTVDKGRKGAEDGGALNGVLGALDTFSWQMLASVLFPSFIINRLVCYLTTLGEVGAMPDILSFDFLPTIAGLIAIPLIIVPLDCLAHFTMNGSYRRLSAELKGK